MSPSPLVDLSAFTLDERTFLQLRAIGLVEDSMARFVDSSITDKKTTDAVSTPSVEVENPDEDGNDELEDVVSAMKSDLSSLESRNDKRVAFLQANAVTDIVNAKRLKVKQDEEAALTAKCLQVLKRSKDAKAKSAAKPKAIKKDEYGLPW